MLFIGDEGVTFLEELGRCIKAATQESLSHQLLLQRISVAIQRDNAAAVLGSLGEGKCWTWGWLVNFS